MSEASTSGNTRDGGKLGATIAKSIEREILRYGWKAGEFVGSEADLLERYNVSRPVLREAVRLVEYHGIARMRRGPGGGLIVAEPDIESVIGSIALFLEFQACTPEALFETRTGLELTAVQMAAERIDEQGIVYLRRVIDEEKHAPPDDAIARSHFHTAVAELTGNPSMVLFIQSLTRLADEYSTVTSDELPPIMDSVWEHHAQIGEAVIAGDPSLARHRMLRHLEVTTAYLEDYRSG